MLYTFQWMVRLYCRKVFSLYRLVDSSCVAVFLNMTKQQTFSRSHFHSSFSICVRSFEDNTKLRMLQIKQWKDLLSSCQLAAPFSKLFFYFERHFFKKYFALKVHFSEKKIREAQIYQMLKSKAFDSFHNNMHNNEHVFTVFHCILIQLWT